MHYEALAITLVPEITTLSNWIILTRIRALPIFSCLIFFISFGEDSGRHDYLKLWVTFE